MILKSIDNLLNRKVLCFSVNSLEDVKYAGELIFDNIVIRVEPILNINMFDLDNSLFELVEGNITESCIGKDFRGKNGKLFTRNV